MADVVDPRLNPRDYIFIQTKKATGSVAFEKRLLASRSKFLDAAAKKDHGLAVITLPPYLCTDTAAEVYLDYIHSNRIRVGYYHSHRWFPFGVCKILVDLYLLGQYVEDAVLQDDVMDTLLATYRDGQNEATPWLPGRLGLSAAYDHTPVGSPLRKFLVDIHIWAGCVGPQSDRTHKVFLQELLAELMSRKANDSVDDLYEAATALMRADEGARKKGVTLQLKPPSEDKQAFSKIPASVSCCDYHKHDAGAECGNKKRKRELEEDKERAAKKR
ncbi:hypothetical protein PRZ48_011926 [Zasmidium cellare]|uniref:Uncharacterized protein n=1 Tax=Zasmidium cellare TaxID=395010 RepID=A0ABR0E7Y0_ZASCE|nr:hypothetical protein PRZ48_011926 [Zasmidium cellare]